MCPRNLTISVVLWDTEEQEEEGVTLFLGQRQTADPRQRLWEGTGLVIWKKTHGAGCCMLR